MTINLPADLAEELLETAKATGANPDAIAVAAIRRGLEAGEELTAQLTPVREAFEASGMSEDEAIELFEAEKHALRRERRRTA